MDEGATGSLNFLCDASVAHRVQRPRSNPGFLCLPGHYHTTPVMPAIGGADEEAAPDTGVAAPAVEVADGAGFGAGRPAPCAYVSATLLGSTRLIVGYSR